MRSIIERPGSTHRFSAADRWRRVGGSVAALAAAATLVAGPAPANALALAGHVSGNITGATPRANNSGLRVTVAGLAPDVVAVMRLTGPNRFTTVLRGTSTVTGLAAGQYHLLLSVIPAAFGSYIPAPADIPITIPQSRNVEVTAGFIGTGRANLRGADMHNANLVGWRFVGSDLSDANLTGARLQAGDLTDARLAGADLTNAGLSGAKLRWANLTGARVDHADLQFTDLRQVRALNLHGVPTVIPERFRLADGVLAGPDIDLSGAVLNGIGLDGTNLTGANFANARLQSVSLNRTNLTRASFLGAQLIDSTMSAADLTGADFTEARLDGLRSGRLLGSPRVLPRDWRLDSGFLLGPKANLENALIEARSLPGLNLAGANLRFAHINRSDLAGANLSGAILDRAALVRSNLRRARFTQADVSGLAMEGADLAGVASGRVTGLPASLPTGWRLVAGNLVGPGAVLVGAPLANADLSGLNLTGASLNQANLTGANLFRTNLTATNFERANLTGANLFQATIAEASFGSAVLTGVGSGRVVGHPLRMPTNWRVVGGHLIGPGADLRNATLTRANLAGANLRLARLTGSHLASANLIGADLTGTDLTRADISGADLTNATLFGANLTDSASLGARFVRARYNSASVIPTSIGPPCALGLICLLK